jgi:hypothetical protein
MGSPQTAHALLGVSAGKSINSVIRAVHPVGRTTIGEIMMRLVVCLIMNNRARRTTGQPHQALPVLLALRSERLWIARRSVNIRAAFAAAWMFFSRRSKRPSSAIRARRSLRRAFVRVSALVRPQLGQTNSTTFPEMIDKSTAAISNARSQARATIHAARLIGMCGHLGILRSSYKRNIRAG